MIERLKNKNPTSEQVVAIEKAGLNRVTWAVLTELKLSLILRHRITGEIRVIDK